MLELVANGTRVTVFTRSKRDLKGIPAEAKVVEVDYSSQANLVNAIRDHDVLIACLSMNAIREVQPRLIEAAVSAGIRRYVPSEYSGITLSPMSQKIPLLEHLLEHQNLIKQKASQGCFEYTIFAPGGWPFMFIETMLDFANHTAVLYDGGTKPVSMSRLELTAKGIVVALQDSRQHKNSVVKFHDGKITQRQALEAAQKAVPEAKWKILDLNGEETVQAGLDALAEGADFQSTEVLRMLAASALAKESPFGWSEEEDQAKHLGLSVIGSRGLLELVDKRARGESIAPVVPV